MTAFRLALANLLHDRVRSAVSVTGAGFAVLLIFMQYGFLGALQNTATLLYDRLDFDVLVMSSEYLELSRPNTIKRARLAQARAVEGVSSVVPLAADPALWRNPTDHPTRGGRRWQILVLAADPARLDQTFLPPDRGLFPTPEDRAAAQARLSRVGTVMLDVRSRPDFGTREELPVGTPVALNGRTVELAGFFEVGTGFSYTGLALTSEETFGRLATIVGPDETTFGLVKLAPGADPDAVAARLRAVLPADVTVRTRAEVTEYEQRFWVSQTAIGTFFNAGVVLALVVGAIFVYQMMVADIKKHLPEYATLKAMGYSFGYLFRVVVWQAVFLAAAGYVGGLVGALVLYDVARDAAYLPIAMPPERLAVVLAMAVGMCVGSGLAAVRKVRTADPADLF